jgi:aspartyl-tRNA(Asn)/glutamyl-tRNA(Gln) amidotransferase subunit C
MINITREDVLHLARLSQVSLTEDEVTILKSDLTTIIGYFDQLRDIDTEGVEPTYSVNDIQNVWREDEVQDPLAPRDQLIALAAEKTNDEIVVPKVL